MSQEETETFCELGYICEFESILECNTTIISECNLCSTGRVGLICFFFALIGLVGLVLNSIVVASVLTVEKNMRTNFAYVKLSLAFNDMLWGLLIYLMIIPNIAYTLNTTRQDFEEYVLNSQNTWQSILGTLFLYMCITSSIYHLTFFATQRVVSIKFKYWFLINGKSFTAKGLIAVWVISLVIPSILVVSDVSSSEIGPKYIASRFLYDTTTEGFIFYLGVTILAVIPIVAMTVFTIYTGMLVRKCMQNFNNENGENQTRLKKQNSIFRTLTILEISFVIGIIPLVIYYAAMASLIASTSCFTVASFSITSFFIAIANSIIDPLIYSFRDEEFRESCRRMFKKVQNLPPSVFSS